MIQVDVKKVQPAFDAIDKWLSDIEYLAEEAAKGLIYKAHDIATERSPQYSGDFVANWKLSYKLPDLSFDPHLFPGKQFPVAEGETPFHQGDMPAMLYSINHRTGKLDGFRLGDTLWLSNSAKHDDDIFGQTYAWLIEDGLVKLRPENYGGDGPLKQVKESLSTNYTVIGRHNIRGLF